MQPVTPRKKAALVVAVCVALLVAGAAIGRFAPWNGFFVPTLPDAQVLEEPVPDEAFPHAMESEPSGEPAAEPEAGGVEGAANGEADPLPAFGQDAPADLGLDAFSLADLPTYAGDPSVPVNGGEPYFSLANYDGTPFELFSPLDALGRCGTAFAVVGPETLPAGERGAIGMVRPSGWQIARYDWVDGTYLFNRCHLIGWQLTGQNANELNLITGTRSMNVAGMQPFENEIAAYVRETGNHVLYRVTPVFAGDDLVARGVLMEARSAEDRGAGVCFCVWCYNVEPGVEIDYATGDNWAL